jgi:outer membrane protein assembly factor BamB
MFAAAWVLASGCDQPKPSISDPGLTTVALAADSDPPAHSPSLWTRRVGEDWPRFLGSTFDGKSTETGILTDWSGNALPVVWSMPVGTSYGIGAIAAGRYFQHERVGNTERLRVVRAETGQPLWQEDMPVSYEDLYGYNNGPRDTPAVAGNKVVTYGVAGRLTCRDVVDGKLNWTIDTNAKYGVIQNFFGVGCSPLVHDGKVIVMVGGSPAEDASLPPGRLDRVSPNGSALVAFDLLSGKEIWKAGDDLASYSSPRLMTVDGVTLVLIFARDALLAFDVDSGKMLWDYPHRARILESVNGIVPVVSGNRVLISECYEVGAVMLEVTGSGYKEIWKDPSSRRQQSLRAHWATPIVVGDWLFGCSGRNEPDSDLRCIRWDSGEVSWSDGRRSRSSLLYVDNHFVVLDESGLMQLIKVNPEKMEVITEIDLSVPGKNRQPLGNPYWAAPALSHGLLYVRGSDRVLCLELIPAS